MWGMYKLLTKILSINLIFFCIPSYGVDAVAENKIRFDSTELRITLASRTPQQMAAFYEARGFNIAMLDKIKQYCFITVFIQNKSNDIIWLNLNNWQFISDNHQLSRVDRHQLKKIWQSMNIPLAHQSTFRWTLLPEQLDFRANEREGGNIVLPWTNTTITVTARFDTLSNKSGKPIKIKLDNLQCQKNPS